MREMVLLFQDKMHNLKTFYLKQTVNTCHKHSPFSASLTCCSQTAELGKSGVCELCSLRSATYLSVRLPPPASEGLVGLTSTGCCEEENRLTSTEGTEQLRLIVSAIIIMIIITIITIVELFQ